MTATAEATGRLIRDMSFAAYLALPGINFHTLKLFGRSPAHARYAMLNPDAPTEAQDFGQAFHCAILEPERFKTDFVVAPKYDRRTKEGKANWKAFLEANAGKEFMQQGEDGQAAAIQEACWSHPILGEILRAPGLSEVVGVWTDEETGIECKLRADALRSWAGYSVVADLKSCEDARPEAFGRNVDRYKYNVQAAFYVDGLASVKPYERIHIIPAIEKTGHHGIQCYETDTAMLNRGRREYRRWLRMFAECKKSGIWPSYKPELKVTPLPAWVADVEEEAA